MVSVCCISMNQVCSLPFQKTGLSGCIYANNNTNYYCFNNTHLHLNVFPHSAGTVSITSSLSVTEGDSSEAPFQIAIELQGMNIALDRDVAYMVMLADGTASGQLKSKL